MDKQAWTTPELVSLDTGLEEKYRSSYEGTYIGDDLQGES
jgi:hypothetical protein